jgi:IS5 family transposase
VQHFTFGTDLIEQLDPKDPLLQLAAVVPWQRFDQSFAKYYAQGIGRSSKPSTQGYVALMQYEKNWLADKQKKAA